MSESPNIIPPSRRPTRREARIAREAERALQNAAKSVRIREELSIPAREIRIGADPGSIFSLAMSWTIESADRDGAWSFGVERNWSQDAWDGQLHPKLAEWERLTWAEIDSLTTGTKDRHKMHHAMAPEWPSLSFDFLRDHLGEARSRFPHSLQTVIGTQANAPEKNRLTVMQISDLAKMPVETEDDILGEEFNPDNTNNDNDDDDNSSDDESDSEIDLDPILEHYSIPHYGGVNRVRAMPQQQDIVATWSDAGQVNLFNIAAIRQRFERRKGGETFGVPTLTDIPKKPFYTYKNKQHAVEGYALAWSPVQTGHLATGDCSGRLQLWTPRSDGASSYSVSQFYESSPSNSSSSDAMNSIEDIQWSPTEATVLAGAQCGGNVLIFDTRAPNKAMLSHRIHEADVNVLSWNTLVSNLLATGGDDGTLAVWDLRHFGKDQPEPLARFTPHKTPITSVEWHPTDESMLVASDDVGAYIYDLSVEEDDGGSTLLQQQQQDVPPQLLFVHCGSQQFKEVHWHPQISSCLMSTALTGFSIFIPSNL